MVSNGGFPHPLTSAKSFQAPKSGPCSVKRAQMVVWIQRSGVAHALKDLEKALPSVGSISGLQVKQYVKAMLDENNLIVERIGTVNWYWSFPGADLARRQRACKNAREQRDQSIKTVEQMEIRLQSERAKRVDDQGHEKEEMVKKRDYLTKDLGKLIEELELHKDNDPIELDEPRLPNSQGIGRCFHGSN
jgi:hypothetical protein